MSQQDIGELRWEEDMNRIYSGAAEAMERLAKKHGIELDQEDLDEAVREAILKEFMTSQAHLNEKLVKASESSADASRSMSIATIVIAVATCALVVIQLVQCAPKAA